MAKSRKKAKTPVDTRIPPTIEQTRHSSYHSAGMAFCRIPMIDALHKAGKLSEAEHRRLTHYRDQDTQSERPSPKSCLDIRVGGGGDISASSVQLSARLEVARIERELGSLRDIARAIAIDDWSPATWCCERYGSVQCIDIKGFICFRPIVPEKVAIQELRLAAIRIMM